MTGATCRIAVVLLAATGLCALAPSVLAPHAPLEMRDDARLQEPGASHPLGTDQFGRDVLSRVVHGARTAVAVALVATALALAVGGAIGAAAGFLGGWIDLVLSRAMEGVFAIPDLLMALVVMAVLGASTANVTIALGIVYTPVFARITRGAVLDARRHDYVEAARALGAGAPRLLLRHVLPNVREPLLVQTTLTFGFAILAEAALSYLGLGVEPDAPSWGLMLRDGKDLMERAWWIAVFPGLAITATVFAVNVLGDRLRDALDPHGA